MLKELRELELKRFVICVLLLMFGCNSAWSSQEPTTYGSNEEAGGYAKIKDVTLYYEVYGSGQPLILLHGNQLSIVSFSLVIPELSKHFKVIAVDSRAHGKSTDSGKEIYYSLLAADISCLLKELDISDAYVLGWSDGAIVGLELAHQYPDQIAKFVAMNPNFRPGVELFSIKEQLGKPYDENALSENMRHVRAMVQQPQAEQEQTKYTEDVKQRLNNLIRDYPKFLVSQLATIKTPKMVMVGDYDIISHGHTIELFNALPHSHLAIIPGTSHLFPIEKPELTIQLIVDFLKSEYYDVDPYYFMRPGTLPKE
jgi:pimeloyl-ACP methyl ester carboxylesterase